jgi:hypothetical protein
VWNRATRARRPAVVTAEVCASPDNRLRSARTRSGTGRAWAPRPARAPRCGSLASAAQVAGEARSGGALEQGFIVGVRSGGSAAGTARSLYRSSTMLSDKTAPCPQQDFSHGSEPGKPHS